MVEAVAGIHYSADVADVYLLVMRNLGSARVVSRAVPVDIKGTGRVVGCR